MTIIVFSAMAFLNFVCFLLRRKSKFVLLLNIVTLALIYSGNIREDISDLYRYKLQYIYQYSWFQERGYSLLSYLCSKIGISFNFYLLIIFLIFIGSLIFFCQHYQCNYSVFFLLFSLFYFFFVMEVLRFFLAASMLLIACRFLLEKKNLLFILFTFIAVSFHVSFCVFFLLLFTNLKINNKKFYYTYTAFFLLISVVTVLNGKQVPFVSELSNSLSTSIWMNKDSSFYNGTITAQYSWIYSSLYYFFNFILLYVSKNLIKHAETKKNMSRISRLYDFCFKSNCLFSVVMPFAMMSPTYFRILLFITMLIFILIAAIIGQCYNSSLVDGKIQIYSDRVFANNMILVIFTMLSWVLIWWYVNPNSATMIYALTQNIFY